MGLVLKFGLRVAVVAVLLAGCVPTLGGDEDALPPAPSDTEDVDDAEPEEADTGADGDGPPESIEDVPTALTTVVLSVPDGTSSAARDAAADTLTRRAAAIAPDASVTTVGDEFTVSLPGVTDAAAADALVDESVLSAGRVLESRPTEHPDWPGCARTDDPADSQLWVCEDDDTAHLVEVLWPLATPAGLEVSDQSVNVELADEDVDRLAELTAELACDRDAGRPSEMAVLAGARLVTAAPMAPTVECGRGITGGAVTITAGPEQPREHFEQLVEALETAYEVAPQIDTVHVVVAESPWPRQRELSTSAVEATATLHAAVDAATIHAEFELDVDDGQLPSGPVAVEWLVAPRMFAAAQLDDDCLPRQLGQGDEVCLVATSTVELDSGRLELPPAELDADWPADHLIALLRLPDDTTVTFDYAHP